MSLPPQLSLNSQLISSLVAIKVYHKALMGNRSSLSQHFAAAFSCSFRVSARVPFVIFSCGFGQVSRAGGVGKVSS